MIPTNKPDANKRLWTLSTDMATKMPGFTGFLASFLDWIGPSETVIWCPEEDSNLHSLRNTDLNRARLPIPPSGLVGAHVSGRAQPVNALFPKPLS
jgi:hypothetical protein